MTEITQRIEILYVLGQNKEAEDLKEEFLSLIGSFEYL